MQIAGIDGARHPGGGDRECGGRIEWDQQIASESVSGPSGNDGERNAGACNPGGCPVYGSVAAPRDDKVGVRRGGFA